MRKAIVGQTDVAYVALRSRRDRSAQLAVYLVQSGTSTVVVAVIDVRAAEHRASDRIKLVRNS